MSPLSPSVSGRLQCEGKAPDQATAQDSERETEEQRSEVWAVNVDFPAAADDGESSGKL